MDRRLRSISRRGGRPYLRREVGITDRVLERRLDLRELAVRRLPPIRRPDAMDMVPTQTGEHLRAQPIPLACRTGRMIMSAVTFDRVFSFSCAPSVVYRIILRT